MEGGGGGATSLSGCGGDGRVWGDEQGWEGGECLK